MEPKWAIAFFVVIPLLIMLVSSWWVQSLMNKSKDKLIWAQQDTIQKLLNREPVTYAEAGAKPPKKNTEQYVAWGNTTVDMDEVDK